MKQPIYLNNAHEYDYELIDNNTHTLYASNSSTWTEMFRNTILFQLKDEGNGLKILTKFEDKKRLNYCETSYLYVLFRIIEKNSKYEIAEKSEL